MKSRTHWLAAACILIAGGLGLWKSLSSHSHPGSFLFAGPVGHEATYDVKLSSVAETAPGEPIFSFDLLGDWRVTVLSTDPRGAEVRTRLVARRLVSGVHKEGTERDLEAVKAALAEGVYFRLASDGAITGIRMEGDAPPLAQTIAKSVLSFCQLHRPNTEAERWTREERDQSGRYEAAYYRRSRTSIEKRKVRYLESGAMATAAPGSRLEVRSSDIRFETSEGALVSVRAQETLVASNAMLPTIEARTTFELTRRAGSIRVPDVARLLVRASTLKGTDLDSPPEIRGRARDLDAMRIAGRSLADLRDELRRAPAGDKDGQREQAFGAMAALLRTNPDAVTTALKAILRSEPDASVLIDALGGAGSPEAQSALRAVLDSSLAEKQRYSALLGLSLVPTPTNDTIGKLALLQEDKVFGGQATYGLGSAAFNLKGAEPDRALQVLNMVLKGLSQATKPDGVKTHLVALGNAGMAEALPQVTPHLVSPSHDIRVAAAEALRRIPGDQPDELLATSLLSDSSTFVRTKAAQAIRDRPISPRLVQALDQAARQEGDLAVRFTILKTLSQLHDRAPALRTTVAWLAVNEPNEDLRRAMAGLASGFAVVGAGN